MWCGEKPLSVIKMMLLIFRSVVMWGSSGQLVCHIPPNRKQTKSRLYRLYTVQSMQHVVFLAYVSLMNPIKRNNDSVIKARS